MQEHQNSKMEGVLYSKKIDNLKWIRDFFGNESKLLENELECVRDFTLLWNLFELKIHLKIFKLDKVQKSIEKINKVEKIRLDELDYFINYFKKRYLDSDGNVNSTFNNLNFRGKDNDVNFRNNVINVLTIDQTNPVDILVALIVIVYRFRNNLFHGEKDILKLNQQIDNLQIANQIMMFVLEKYKKNHLL